MATIDLIVLGMLKKEPLSAYDIQKLVEYRNISKWVKISTPSIYKKVLQLEDKGLIESTTVQGENLADKAVYSLTAAGAAAFERLMAELSDKPIHFFLDFNAVIVNLPSLAPAQQKACLAEIEVNVQTLKAYLQENLARKENLPTIPETGLAVLQQQMLLAEAIEAWLATLKQSLAGAESL